MANDGDGTAVCRTSCHGGTARILSTDTVNRSVTSHPVSSSMRCIYIANISSSECHGKRRGVSNGIYITSLTARDVKNRACWRRVRDTL